MLLVTLFVVGLSFQTRLLDLLKHPNTFETAIIGIEELGTEPAKDFIKKSDLPIELKVKAVKRLDCRAVFEP